MKPIIFNTDMVRAILSGRKIVTRRIAKPLIGYDKRCDGASWKDLLFFVSPLTRFLYYEDNSRQVLIDEKPVKAPFRRGDVLYVRETWGDYRENNEDGDGYYFLYRADYKDGATTYQYPGGPVCDLPKWHPSI